MQSAGNKKAIVSLFLSFFLLYAVTPLSIHGGERQPVHFTSQNHTGHVKNIRLFIVDLLASVLSNDSGDESGPTLHFLLLKKKALVTSDKVVKNAFQSCSFVPETALSPETPEIAGVVSVGQSASYSSAYVFPTGLSPPTA